MDDGLKPGGHAFEPLSESDVERIEERFGFRLPDDYVQFLRTYGWAGFRGEADVVLANGTRLPIFVLYGRGEDSDSVLGMLAVETDLHDQGALPIGRDLFGNSYVINAKKNGVIYYVDFSGERPKITRVAETFTGLMDSIDVKPYD